MGEQMQSQGTKGSLKSVGTKEIPPHWGSDVVVGPAEETLDDVRRDETSQWDNEHAYQLMGKSEDDFANCNVEIFQKDIAKDLRFKKVSEAVSHLNGPGAKDFKDNLYIVFSESKDSYFLLYRDETDPRIQGVLVGSGQLVPEQIMAPVDQKQGGNMTLQKAQLNRLEIRLKQKQAELKQDSLEIGFVSVFGKFRQGKSTMLGFLVHYFEWLEEQHKSSSFKARDKMNLDKLNWDEDGLPFTGAPWLPEKLSKPIFEAARGDAETKTLGMWVLPRPFLLNKPDGSGDKFAIVLIDTQGLDDGRLTEDQTTTMIGVSSIISAKSIYNVTKLGDDLPRRLGQLIALTKTTLWLRSESEKNEGLGKIGEESLGCMAKFRPKGSGAEPEVTRRKSRAASYIPSLTKAATKRIQEEDRKEQRIGKFGSLSIIIRDKEFDDEEPDTVEACVAKVEKDASIFLDPEHIKDEAKRKEAEALRQAFAEVHVFGLPGPGNTVQKGLHLKETSEGLTRDKLSANFMRLLDEWVRREFEQEGALCPSQSFLSGEPVTVANFQKYLQDECVGPFQSSSLEGGAPKFVAMQVAKQKKVEFQAWAQRSRPEIRTIFPEKDLKAGSQKSVDQLRRLLTSLDSLAPADRDVAIKDLQTEEDMAIKALRMAHAANDPNLSTVGLVAAGGCFAFMTPLGGILQWVGGILLGPHYVGAYVVCAAGVGYGYKTHTDKKTKDNEASGYCDKEAVRSFAETTVVKTERYALKGQRLGQLSLEKARLLFGNANNTT